MATLKAAFDFYDADKDDSLNADELEEMLTEADVSGTGFTRAPPGSRRSSRSSTPSNGRDLDYDTFRAAFGGAAAARLS